MELSGVEEGELLEELKRIALEGYREVAIISRAILYKIEKIEGNVSLSCEVHLIR